MTKLVIGEGSCGIAAGAAKVYDTIQAGLPADSPVSLGITGCIGMCFLEPIVDVYQDGALALRLVKVPPERGADIAQAAVSNDFSAVEDLKITPEDSSFL